MATIGPLKVLRNAQDSGSSATGADRLGCEPGYSFAGFRLDSDGTLWRGSTVVHLPPKELAALRLLLAHAGQIVSPARLRQALWGDVHVTADSVPRCLSSLRARLAPDECIQTVYKRGYRFAAEIIRHPGAAFPVPLRLAVAPFVARTFVPDHLGTAIAEETIASLSRVNCPDFAVLARDSVFNLALRRLTAQQLGRELQADLVLTGTLQAFVSHYRLRAEMIRVEDGVQIWVEDLLAPQNQTGRLESELLQRLSSRLGIAIPADRSFWPEPDQGLASLSAAADGEDENIASFRPAEAYDIFLRGHHEWQTMHRHRMQDGLQHLLRAIELDPSLTAARIDLGDLCVTQALYGFMSPASAADLTHRVAEAIPDLHHRAAALLPSLGWTHFHYDRNLPAALLAFSASAHLPHSPWITRARALFLLSRARFSEAIALLRAALPIDPFSPCLQNRLAWALHLSGQRDESLHQTEKNLAQFPEHEGTGIYGAIILAYNGEAERGVRLAEELSRRLPDFDLAPAVHAYALACAGRGEEARILLERLQWLGRERYLGRTFLPAAYLALGDQQAALDELRAVNEARCPWFFQMLADPRLEPLHGRAEFEWMREILIRMEADAEHAWECKE
ncbi:MAG: winged helix-turn-helix domain-containing protein [Terracidiphilus sp.]